MKRFVCAVAAAGLLVIAGGSAHGHGSKDVGGVSLTVGWAHEPAFAGAPNAIELIFERDGRGVPDAEKDLQLTLSAGRTASSALDPRPAPGDDGTYYVDVTPSDPGEYTVNITGTLDGDDVDETFSGTEDGIEDVRPSEAVSFPQAAPAATTEAGDVDGDDSSALPIALAAIATIIALAALAVAVSTRGSRTTPHT